jgi:hypothetical protein
MPQRDEGESRSRSINMKRQRAQNVLEIPKARVLRRHMHKPTSNPP